MLQEACTLFGREELDSALEVDGAVVCTGVVGGVSGGEASVGSLGVHSDSSLVLCRSRGRVLAVVAGWENSWDDLYINEDSLPVWAWDDEVVALAAVASDIDAFAFVSERLRTSDSFMRDVVARNSRALEYASAELRSDRELVLAAVAKHGFSLRHASERLRGDEDVAKAAVAKHGFSLKYASKSLRNNKGVVLIAVAKYGPSLQHASENLRADKELKLAAAASRE